MDSQSFQEQPTPLLLVKSQTFRLLFWFPCRFSLDTFVSELHFQNIPSELKQASDRDAKLQHFFAEKLGADVTIHQSTDHHNSQKMSYGFLEFKRLDEAKRALEHHSILVCSLILSA